MAHRKTKEEFVEESNNKHKNYYSYDKVIYSGALSKVTITCPVHGDFEQLANSHVRGAGCKKCHNDSRTKTTEDFITESKEIHGDLYDYSSTKYVKVKTLTDIVCREHGSFRQTPDKHLRGHGCPVCANTHETAKANFKNKSVQKHGNKYVYDKVNYITAITKVTISCPMHGDFEQTPNSHLTGAGCPVCSNNSKRHSADNFVKNCELIHGKKYNYSKSVYDGANVKLLITCPTHGDFKQVPTSHLSGNGCPKCAKYGFDSTSPAWFYIYNIEDKYLGFGITNDMQSRHKQHITTFKNNKIKATLLYTFKGDGENVLACETNTKRNFKTCCVDIKGFKSENTKIEELAAVVNYIKLHLTQT